MLPPRQASLQSRALAKGRRPLGEDLPPWRTSCAPTFVPQLFESGGASLPQPQKKNPLFISLRSRLCSGASRNRSPKPSMCASSANSACLSEGSTRNIAPARLAESLGSRIKEQQSACLNTAQPPPP